MADFQKQYPKVSFILQQGDYTSIQEWTKSGKIDFGFINPQASLQLKTIELASTPLIAMNHPLADNPFVQVADLANESFILLEEGHYNEVLEVYREPGLSSSVSYTIHDDHTIMSMVEAGHGVSILAKLKHWKVNYNIVQRSTKPPICRPFSIAFTDRSILPLASQRFIDFILANKHLLC